MVAETDLDYAKVTGRFAITVGDGADPGDAPDIVWCDGGEVHFDPLVTVTKVLGASLAPFTAANSTIVAKIGVDGRVTYREQPHVHVLDLTSPKVNPRVTAGAATHQVSFVNVTALGARVTLPTVKVRITEAGPDGDGVNDLTILMPVAASALSSVVRGPKGTGVQSLAVASGDLVATFDDGTEVNAGALPVGPGGSNEGVASYIEVEGPTKSALSASIAESTLGPAVVKNLPTPFAIAHRGGGALYPEETFIAFDSAIAAGINAIEIDVHLLADGTLIAMHDVTVNRTTNGTGNVSDKMLAEWVNLTVETDANAVGTWPTERPPIVADILTRYGNRVCIAAQPYSVAAVEELDALVTRMGVKKSTILVQCASTAYADAAVLAGFPTAVIHDSPASFNLPAYKAAGYQMVGCLEGNITQAFIDNAHAEGLKVITYSIFRQKRYDEIVAMGVDGIFTDDPAYHCNRAAIERATDAFAAQRPWAGQHNIAGTSKFFAPDQWGWDVAASNTSIARLGYLKPPNSSDFTLTFDANITDSKAIASLGFQMWVGNDDFWVNGGAGPGRTNDGYLMSAQAATTTGLSIEHYENNVRTSYVKYRQPVTSYADGTWYTYKLTVTPTTIKWERTDDPSNAFQATHSLTRPLRYICPVALIAGVKFRNFALA